MNIRKVDIQKDYEMLAKWWLHHGWGDVPAIILPKEGFIVNEICAGFIYQTDSKIAWIEYIVSDPASEKEYRAQSLDILIDNLIKRAKELGFLVAFATLEHPALIERYKKHGFVIGDSKVTNMIRSL